MYALENDIFFQVTTVACLACLCTSGTVKIGLFMLPLVGRIRFMMFVTLISLFVTCLLLFLDISHVVYLFPFNWGKVVSYVCQYKINLFLLFFFTCFVCWICLLHIIVWTWTYLETRLTNARNNNYTCCIYLTFYGGYIFNLNYILHSATFEQNLMKLVWLNIVKLIL